MSTSGRCVQITRAHVNGRDRKRGTSAAFPKSRVQIPSAHAAHVLATCMRQALYGLLQHLPCRKPFHSIRACVQNLL